MNSRFVPGLIVVAALAVVPVAMWYERLAPTTWQEPLVRGTLPTNEPPSPGTGQQVPPVFEHTQTLTAADGPFLLRETVTIPTGVTVTIGPGVLITADDDARLLVEGHLVVQGNAAAPVRWKRQDDQAAGGSWHGIQFAAGGRGTLTSAVITGASTGVSCLAGSVVQVAATEIADGAVGVYTESPSCRLVEGAITRVREGVIGRGVTPDITGTVITARRQPVQTLSTDE